MDAAKQYGLFAAAAVIGLAGLAAPESWQLVLWLAGALVATCGVVVHSARWGVVASASLAFGCAAYLFTRKLDGAGGPSRCNVNEVLNCDLVNTSAASELFGIPIALLGMGFYGGLVLAALTKEGTTARFFRADVLFAAVNILYSLYLGYQSKVIGAVCVVCFTMYLSHAVMLWAGFKGLAGLEAKLTDDLPGVFTSTTVLTIGATFAIIVLVGQSVWKSNGGAGGRLDGKQPVSSSSGAGTAVAPVPASALAQTMASPRGTIELDGTEAILGDPQAPYMVVEFADYGCPHCAQAAKQLKVLVQEMPEIQVRFKAFPLSGACNPLIEKQDGAERCKAAMAAECAGAQGKFWDLQSLIFANQTHLGDGDLAFMAEQAGIDIAPWEACMSDQTVFDGIVADAVAGGKAGVWSTPTLYLAGVTPSGYVESCRGPEGVLELVEAHKAGRALPTPMPECPR